MIHTIYCNVYEGLEAALIENIHQELQILSQNPDKIFQEIEIIPASSAIEDRLARSLADRFSIVPGVKFCSIFDWLKPYLGATFRPSSIGTSLDWQIWDILKNPEFLKNLKEKIPSTSFDRLNNFLQKPDEELGTADSELIEFCFALSTLYATYGSYRMDWLLNWISPATFPLLKTAEKIMEQQPDYHWQKELWKTIAERSKTKDLRNLKLIPETIRNFHFSPKDRDKSLHLFMPFSLPPILLPFLKAFAEDKNAPDLWLYIMNPSAEFWFDALPVELFDWSLTPDPSAQNYLIQQSPSTRAMIDRLYRFLNVDDNEIIETDDIENKKLRAPKKTQIQRNKNDLKELRKNLDVLSPEQRLFTKEDIQAWYFQSPQDSYLHKFQNSILFLDSEKLPARADESDESLKVFKAPSFPREIEGIIDWLHYRLTEDQDLKLSEVAVIVPDIEKATPAIEAVMGGLPDEMRLPYKIIGNSVADTYLTISAILGLGHLLNSRFDAKALENWLELPVNLEKWNLSLTDISTISNWIASAGFRYGLSEEHLKELNEEISDSTLSQTIERLTLGYFISPEEKNIFQETLPVFGDEVSGFDIVTDDRGRLFKTLISLYEILEKTRKNLFKDGAQRTPAQWHALINEWLNDFFDTNSASQEVATFRNALQRLSGAMQEGLDEGETVPFSVLWNVIETHLKATKNPSLPNGSITFGSVSDLRGLPYKAIALAGFDEASRFPGSTSHLEFDLMGVAELKRRADRDSREDNRARFLDCMLAARKYLILSYTIGTDPKNEAPSSSVIQSFKNYFTHHALMQENGKELATELWDNIQVKLPLNSFSEKNFQKSGARNWVSPNRGTLKSVEYARESNYSEEEKTIAGYPIVDSTLDSYLSDFGKLPANELINFLVDPNRYSLKKHKLQDEFSIEENDYLWLPASDSLSYSMRKRQLFEQFERGYSLSELEKRADLNPLNGIKEIRLEALHSDISQVENSFNLRGKFIKKFKLTKVSVDFSAELTSPVGSIKRIEARSDEIYRSPSGAYVIFDYEFSKTDSLRRKLLSMVFNAAGEYSVVVDMETITKTLGHPNEDFLSLPTADEFKEKQESSVKRLRQYTTLFELNHQYSIGYTTDEKGGMLWRGYDFSEAYSLSKKIKKIIEENDLNDENAAEELSRLISALVKVTKTEIELAGKEMA